MARAVKIVSVVGARPQFVKLGAVCQAIVSRSRTHPGAVPVEHRVIHTGQHYDLRMSDVFFTEMELPAPDVNLGVGSGSHGQQTGRMMEQLESEFVKRSPDLVLVYGDTNSTLAAALAASKLHVPIAHVEAGLRSRNKSMPEEVNRVLTDHVSCILFCPTRQAIGNAVAEGLSNVLLDGDLYPVGRGAEPLLSSGSVDHPLVINVGDVMYDVYCALASRAEAQSSILHHLRLSRRSYALVTIHRAENTDDPERLQGIMQGLHQLAEEGVRIIFPAHPRTRKALEGLEGRSNRWNIEIVDPVGYLDMVVLERNASSILTDSGGVQKEAYFAGVPCVTLRDQTEWVELVEAGWNELAGADPRRIFDAGCRALSSCMSTRTDYLYGDGRAAERIVHVVADWVQCASA